MGGALTSLGSAVVPASVRAAKAKDITTRMAHAAEQEADLARRALPRFFARQSIG